MTAEPWDDAEGGALLTALRALANGERLAVLQVLRGCPAGLNISQVAAATELSRFTASRHLKLLCAAGLVTATRCEQSVVHRIAPQGFEPVEDWLYDMVPAADPVEAVHEDQGWMRRTA